MRILKRLVVWSVETSLEALFLAVALIAVLGDSQHAYIKDIAVSFVWIATMFFSTGYLLSTGVARAAWQPTRVWLYSLIAVMLFLIHFEILNYAAGGIFDPTKRAVIRISGACIVYACTFAGNLTLRNWTRGRSKIADVP